MNRAIFTISKLVLTFLMLFSLSPDAIRAQTLPGHWDWNELGKVTPARNQGACGSVAAFAAVAAVESKILILADVALDLSEQQIVSCGGGVTCSGGYANLALEYIRDVGLMQEAAFPYQAGESVECPTLPAERVKIEGFYHVDMSGDRAEQIARIKEAIYNDGPVVAYFELYDDFSYYSDGVYRRTSGSNGVMSNLLLVGWDDSENCWIAKFSWGETWGSDGFVRIDRDTEIGLYRYPPLAVLRTDCDGDGVWDANRAPVANAGPDQRVQANTVANLDGGDSLDAEGDYPLSYFWEITSTPAGSSAVLSDPEAVNPYFTADLPGEYTVTLVVTDSLGLSSPEDAVRISALPGHWDWNEQGKVTPARDQGACGSVAAFAAVAAVESKILILADVALDLSEQQIVSCGGGVTCSGGAANLALEYIRDVGLMQEKDFGYQSGQDVPCPALPAGRAKIEGFYHVDMSGDRAGQIASIKEAIYNDGPVVAYFEVYGDFYPYIGGVYQRTSDSYMGMSNLLLVGWDDSENCWIAKFSWGETWGSDGFVRIDRDTEIGLYRYPPLAVLRTDCDGDGVWDTDRAPVANAGPDQTVHVGISVNLDGSGSADTDGNYPLSYFWEITSTPAGSSASLSDTDVVNPYFTADLPGEYTVTLVVTDSLGLSSPEDAVRISTTNSPPVADAGDDQAIDERGVTVYLDGKESYDQEGDPVTYQWAITEMPAGSSAALDDSTSPTPSFVADAKGTYRVSLTVSDPWAASSPDEVVVSFENIKPVADAGENQSVTAGAAANLDGTRSSDADGDTLSYMWSIVARPDGSLAEIDSRESAQPSLPTDLPGTYVVSLVVNDGFVDSDPSNATITAISRQDAITWRIREIMDVINAIEPTALKNEKMINALTNKINEVLTMIDAESYEEALNKLEHDILAKTNGCAGINRPDKNDWIIDCHDQGQVYPLIIDVISQLQNVVNGAGN